jgi:hypothetical protein
MTQKEIKRLSSFENTGKTSEKNVHKTKKHSTVEVEVGSEAAFDPKMHLGPGPGLRFSRQKP